MSKRKFWPLDFDLEGEIYENLAWDLPGFRPTHGLRSVRRTRNTRRPGTTEPRS
jgi:hypothetical protein